MAVDMEALAMKRRVAMVLIVVGSTAMVAAMEGTHLDSRTQAVGGIDLKSMMSTMRV